MLKMIDVKLIRNFKENKGTEVWKYNSNGEYGIGNHRIVWNAMNTSGNALPSGVYFIQLKAGHNIATQKVLFMK